MSDSRRKFIITSASTLLGYLDDSKTSSKVRDCIESSKAVTTFLENENCSLLQVICSIPTKNNSTPEIVLSNKMRSDTVWDGKDFRCSQVLFVKLRPTPITDDNFAQVIMVSSMLDSPIHALYNATHRVYAPMLLRDKSWSTKMAPKMQKLLAVMDSGLGSLVRRGSSELADIHDKKAMASILVPSDEFDVWKMLANNRTNGESAQKFSEIFSGISNEMGDNLTMTLPDILELVDDTQNCLDDIWKADVRQSSQYPQHRMKHIFSVIASALARYVSSYLGSTDIWQGAYAEVASRLQEAILVCERWSLVTADLSGSFWPSCEEHPWEGAAYEEQHIKNLSERLESILKVRTTHEELLRLLSIQEQRELNVASAFDPFNASDLRPLHYNPYTKSRWEDAVAMHDRQLAPIEQHIASNLRKQISGMSEHPQQLLREFLRYRQLLGRRTIAKALHGERETLLAQLSAYVEQCDQDYESSKSSANVSSGAPLGRNLPIVTNNIVWAKQCEARMRGLLTRSRHILSDLSLYDDFKGMIQELMEKLRTWRRNEFQNWVDATEYLLDDGELSLEVSGQLMEIDVDGELIVNYSEKLVRLLREVRQLEDLGHQVNSRIKGVASDGEKYYRYGVMLKKIANFYNSMGNQIVVTQKPMLLDALKRFENQLHRGNKRGAKKAVTWNNPRECQDFLAVQTAELMNIDLLRQRDQWKSKWFDMRDKVSDLTRKYPTERMANWKLHWDHQLCKALEAGYCMGLESLNENMLEIKVELCFTQRRLEFRPAIEDIRTQYFRELRRFLAIPVAFDGFGNKAVYKSIEKENAESLIQVYKKAEDLFRQLWVALGTVPDMDEYVEENVSSAAEYQVNFAMLKKRLKQSEKLPEFYKLDCINVSAAPFKSAVEDHIQRMSDALLLSLKRSVLRMVSTVEEFLDNGMQQLNSRPTSIEEIGLAQKAWGELSGSKKSIKMEMRRADERRKLLISVAGNRVDVEEVRVRLGRLPSRWENFEVAMEAFNDLVEEQRETLKGEIDMRIKEANESVEKLALRWHALKPQGEVNNWNPETIQGIFDSLEDWQEQMEEKVKEVNTLKNNCVHFDMPVPKFPTLTELQADMQETQENWINFRTRIYELSDFVQNWLPKVKTKKDVVSIHLKEVLGILKSALPALKFCKGDVPFNEVHWASLFRQLGIPKGTRLENLNAGHFLDRLEAVAKSDKFCRDLTARATGEVHNQSLLGSLKDSPYFRAFAAEASVFEKNFSDLDQILHNLNLIQRKWLYLEPIFGRGALPHEHQRFQRIDDEFRDIMSKVEDDKRVLTLSLLEQLERCTKALADFLEQKREKMPRFYFIGDEDLLEILGQAKNPTLFQGVQTVEFNEDNSKIIAIKSGKGEESKNALQTQLVDFKAMVLDLIHNMDVVDYLIQNGCPSINTWSWQKQLRFYMNKRDLCNASKLVHTPLTDKCYLTLTQGMHQGYGGNPYGPAGTGKTESVKALGAALGRQGIDFQSMGPWGCFDEFNRLKEDQLSAVMSLLGRNIQVDSNAGYGGRSKLPDNLKQLFRPVAIKELLSPQQHYDWGLRALKSILVTAESGETTITETAEEEILIKSVRVNTLSKLTYQDASRFVGLCSDIFPNAKVEDIAVPKLEDAIRAGQLSKMLQLKESLDQRMGFWRVLKEAMIKCGQELKTYVMNPKSMPRELLLGHMDLDTREWFDGVLTSAAKQVVKEPSNVRSWIICDGDVDPEWIESLNSVLDDNHLLTLPSGERINFGPNVNFLFETHDLQFASPATISRMGMIFLSDEDVDVKRLVRKWLSTLPSANQLAMVSWIDDYFYRALKWVLDLDRFVVDTTMVGGNLVTEDRANLATQLFSWANERPPDPEDPLNSVWDSKTHKLIQGIVIPTAAYQRNVTMVGTWAENMKPFIIVGPEGSGKSALIEEVLGSHKNTNICTLHCNARTTAEHVIQKLRSSVLRPRDCERLLCTFQGFYDDDLEFLGLDRVVVVCSINPATTLGRHQLSSPYMEEPTPDELSYIYTIYLRAALSAFKQVKNIEKLASTMVKFYEQIRAKFTVDEHRHYLLTPRDLTNWVLGLGHYDLSIESLLDVVIYEARRLMKDRLVDSSSEKKFDTILSALFRKDCTLVKDSSSNGIEGKHASEGKDNVSESDFIDVVKRDLTLLLFTEVLEHISRVDRVLSRPGGSLLLVGRSGCGRKTTVQLCAFMQDIRFITPFITRRYSQKSFHVDLKNVLFEGGIEGRPVVFYLEDYHFIGDYILQSVNSLLSAGEISGLYTHEELEQLLSPLKEEMNERGLDMVYKTAFDYFVQRCRDNVHIALGMDHISPEFRQRCMSNPALFTRCSIQWFGEWEYSSMLVVPKLDTLVQSMVDIHKNSENAFFRRKTDTATPRDFMSFLETYLILYENMKVDILSNANRMEGGLAKLQEASMTVDELSKNAVQQRATLAEKQQEADAAMVKITEALELASERKSEVTELQTVLSAAKSKTDKRKGLIEEELSGIQPVLDAAKKAVGQIKSENLDEIRSLKTPPDPIRHVLSAVLTLLGINDTSWLSMRNFLGKQMRKLVGKTMKKNPNSFEKKAIQTVMPLQEELDKANSELKYASEKLKSNAKELKTIQNKVNRLKKDLEKTEIVLEKAETLLGKLMKQLRSEVQDLPYRILLAAGFVTYLAKSDENIRLDSFDFRSVLSSESEQLTWKAAGLPSDNLTMENSIVILNSKRTPFIIDPSSAATSWLKGHLQKSGVTVECLPSQDPRFANQVELAVRFGKTLMLMEVDGVEPMLYPLVRRDFSRQGSRLVVQIGEKTIDFNEKFVMYMVTRNPNPSIPPDAASLITLLGATIQHEKPELEKQKKKDLLKTLAESSGNLLENQDLIDSLTQTKIKSKEIMIALEESTKASEELDSQRDVYLDFARDGAQLFFLVTYETIHERLKVLTPLLIQRTLFYVGRSLFKADRQMWAIHLVHGMYPNEFEENEWEFFGGYLAPDLRARGEPKGFPSWAPRERASTFRLFSDTFPELVSRLELLDSDMWSKWSRSATCERNFPKKMAQKLSAFQRLLTVQVLRPDRLQSAMDVFACELLGLSSISPTPTNVSRLHQEESSCETPILFIVTTGVDPCKDLQDYAAQTVGEDNYFEMAMGGGTQDKAIRLLQRCAERGTWLCLKNLHLVIAWLPVLEKTLNSLHSHKNFRLWLTAESHDKFPTILVQQALKCTVEAPPGVKKNLQRTYDSWNEEFVSAGSGKRSQVMFLLAFIHAIVQERRNYIPQGWSEFYEFSLGDLRAATNVIESALKSSDTMHGLWNTVHGMMENALYGGRVSNIFDMRVLKAYLSFYFSDAIIPKSSNHGEYFSFIGRLPDSDAPSLFGLPANIERSAQRANSTRIIKDLKRLKRSSGEHSAFNQDVWRAQLGPVIDTWEKTLKNSKANGSLISPRYNEGKNNFEGKSKSFEGGAFDPESPVSQFVQMELAGASSLMHIVDGDLKAVKQVLHGNALLTPAIANTARCLMNSIVPVRWDRKWEGPETPQVYMSAVAAKCEAVHHWRELINSKSLLDSPLNLADLLHPGTFLNALRQETSRVTKCPLDDLKLISAWDRSLVKGSLKVCVEGLLLQGAVFTDKVLEEANVNDLELMSAPTCYIGFVPNDTVEPYGSENTLHAPLYYNTSRERLLTELGLPIKGQREKWILAGVALFLEDC
eukprot:GSMAST32.ASY1.ANO1.1018.1 assembled CDS